MFRWFKDSRNSDDIADKIVEIQRDRLDTLKNVYEAHFMWKNFPLLGASGRKNDELVKLITLIDSSLGEDDDLLEHLSQIVLVTDKMISQVGESFSATYLKFTLHSLVKMIHEQKSMQKDIIGYITKYIQEDHPSLESN